MPTGEIVANRTRGTFTGNRGIIHVADKQLGTARWSHHAWICCTLDWQGRKRELMTGRKWTELFFLDEAVALAAGHRPCGYCRRADYTMFAAAWSDATGDKPSAKAMDRALHRARIVKGTRSQKRITMPLQELPNGTMILQDGTAQLVWGDALRPYAPDGYGPPKQRPDHLAVEVLTPAPMIMALRAGYVPDLHPTSHL